MRGLQPLHQIPRGNEYNMRQYFSDPWSQETLIRPYQVPVDGAISTPPAPAVQYVPWTKSHNSSPALQSPGNVTSPAALQSDSQPPQLHGSDHTSLDVQGIQLAVQSLVDGIDGVDIIQRLYDGLGVAVASARVEELRGLPWSELPDEACLLLCMGLSAHNMGFACCKTVLSLILLPKFQALTSAASQSLVTAFGEAGASNTSALMESVVHPTVSSTSLNAAQGELVCKLLRASPANQLALQVGLAIGRPTSSPSYWNDHTVTVLQAVFNCKPPFSQEQLGHLLEALGEAACQPQLQKSVKLVKLLTTIIQTYPNILVPHLGTLQRIAACNTSFTAKGLQDRVEKLLTLNP